MEYNCRICDKINVVSSFGDNYCIFCNEVNVILDPIKYELIRDSIELTMQELIDVINTNKDSLNGDILIDRIKKALAATNIDTLFSLKQIVEYTEMEVDLDYESKNYDPIVRRCKLDYDKICDNCLDC